MENWLETQVKSKNPLVTLYLSEVSTCLLYLLQPLPADLLLLVADLGAFSSAEGITLKFLTQLMHSNFPSLFQYFLFPFLFHPTFGFYHSEGLSLSPCFSLKNLTPTGTERIMQWSPIYPSHLSSQINILPLFTLLSALFFSKYKYIHFFSCNCFRVRLRLLYP